MQEQGGAAREQGGVAGGAECQAEQGLVGEEHRRDSQGNVCVRVHGRDSHERRGRPADGRQLLL